MTPNVPHMPMHRFGSGRAHIFKPGLVWVAELDKNMLVDLLNFAHPRPQLQIIYCITSLNFFLYGSGSGSGCTEKTENTSSLRAAESANKIAKPIELNYAASEFVQLYSMTSCEKFKGLLSRKPQSHSVSRVVDFFLKLLQLEYSYRFIRVDAIIPGNSVRNTKLGRSNSDSTAAGENKLSLLGR